MAKESGLGWTTFSIDDETGAAAQDLRAPTNSLEWSVTKAVLEVTGIDKSAMERLHGLADFSGTANFTFDDATSNSPHDVAKDLSGTRTVLIVVSGQTLTNECLLTDYSYTRADDGSLKGTIPWVLQSGIVPAWT